MIPFLLVLFIERFRRIGFVVEGKKGKVWMKKEGEEGEGKGGLCLLLVRRYTPQAMGSGKKKKKGERKFGGGKEVLRRVFLVFAHV